MALLCPSILVAETAIAMLCGEIILPPVAPEVLAAARIKDQHGVLPLHWFEACQIVR